MGDYECSGKGIFNSIIAVILPAYHRQTWTLTGLTAAADNSRRISAGRPDSIEIVMNFSSPSNILQAIYDSEINFELSTFWCGGFNWKLGDPANGYHAEGNAETLDGAIQQLAEAVRRHFPSSVFAGGKGDSSESVLRRNPPQCNACLQEHGAPGPQRSTKVPMPEFDLLIAARRKCPKCGADVFFERDIVGDQA